MSVFTEMNKIEDVLEKAHKNGWIAEEDKQAITAIYNFAKNEENESDADTILSSFMDEDVWSPQKREPLINLYKAGINKLYLKGGLPEEVKKIFDTNIAGRKVTQKDMDAEYVKIFGKEREKTPEEIEIEKKAEEKARKKAEQERILKIRNKFKSEIIVNRDNFRKNHKDLYYIKDFERYMQDMGWIYRVTKEQSVRDKKSKHDSDLLWTLHELFTDTNDEKLNALFEKVIKTNINIREDRISLLNEIKNVLKEIRNTDTGIGFGQAKIDMLIDGLVPEVPRNVLDRNYFKHLEYKEKRDEEDRVYRDRNEFIKILGANGWKISDYNDDFTLRCIYGHYAKLKSGKGKVKDYLGLDKDVYLENVDKDGIYDAYIQKLMDTKIDPKNPYDQYIALLEEGKRIINSFGDEFGSRREMSNIIDRDIKKYVMVKKEIEAKKRDSLELRDKLKDRVNRNANSIRTKLNEKGEALRQKREQNRQIKERAKEKAFNAEKSDMAPKYNLSRDLIVTYNAWRDNAVKNLTGIKNRLNDILLLDDQDMLDEYYNFGKDYLDSIQKSIDTLKDNSKSPEEVIKTLADLYNASKKQLSDIGKVDKIAKDSPEYFKVQVAKSASDMTKYSQSLMIDYSSIKKWFNNTGLKTQDNKKFSDASMDDIGKKMNEIHVKYQIQNDKVIYNPLKLAKNLSDKAQQKIDLITKVESKYKVKCDVLFNKDSQNAIAIKKNPTAEEAAKHYILTKYVNDIMSMNVAAAPEQLLIKQEEMNSGKLDKDIKALAKDPLFKDLVNANPKTYYEDMNRIIKDADDMTNEYANELAEATRYRSPGDYVLYGVEVVAESTLKDGKKAGYARKMKESPHDMSREDYLDQVYSRLGQVVLSQILTDPNNKRLVQGICAGQYDVFEMKEKMLNYFKEKNTFGLDKPGVNLEEFSAKVANGEIKSIVMDKVIKKMKPESLVEKKAAEIAAEIARQNNGPAAHA